MLVAAVTVLLSTALLCETVIDATPIDTDTHHLNAFGSTMLALADRERFGNPLSGPPPSP